MLSEKNKKLLIGCLCGLISAALVGVYVTGVHAEVNDARKEALARFGGEQVQVCVAKHDIAAGQTISDSDVEERLWVTSLLPADAVIERGEAVGRQVGSTILSGEVISQARFGSENSAIDVPEGKYAVSVPARDVQAVGGALVPGTKTDVYCIGSSGATRLASNVVVLASSATKDVKAKTSDAWITLALAPSRVREIIQAAENQTLYFALPAKGMAEANTDDEENKDEFSSPSYEGNSGIDKSYSNESEGE